MSIATRQIIAATLITCILSIVISFAICYQFFVKPLQFELGNSNALIERMEQTTPQQPMQFVFVERVGEDEYQLITNSYNRRALEPTPPQE